MDFTNIINQALANGASADDLAKQFTDALNAADSRNKSKKEKEDYIDQQKSDVYEAVDEGCWSFAAAACVATITAADVYREWSLKDLQAYRKSTEEALRETARLNDSIIQDDWNAVIDRLFDNFGKPKAWQTKPCETDDEKISRFLGSL